MAMKSVKLTIQGNNPGKIETGGRAQIPTVRKVGHGDQMDFVLFLCDRTLGSKRVFKGKMTSFSFLELNSKQRSRSL